MPRGGLLEQPGPYGHANEDEYGTSDKLTSLSQTGAQAPTNLQAQQ